MPVVCIWDKFRESFGSHFLYSVNLGASIIVDFTINGFTKEDVMDVGASINFKYSNPTFELEGKGEFNIVDEEKKINDRTTSMIYTSGLAPGVKKAWVLFFSNHFSYKLLWNCYISKFKISCFYKTSYSTGPQ